MRSINSIYLTLIICIIFYGISCIHLINKNQNNKDMPTYNKLTPEEEFIILNKGTEHPFSGEYVTTKRYGTYLCKRCNTPLYRSADKFDSHCGWPSFDDEIEGAVKHIPDADGKRTEITCANCGGHLGHIFLGEQFTSKNTRHCVNSISLKFIPEENDLFQKAYFACGCFWGAEYYFMKQTGVEYTTVGYMGGLQNNPTYKEVCTQNTGHLETTEVTYNPQIISYDKLVKLFFEIHDFSQTNGQGPDIGSQYLSVAFYNNEEEKKIIEYNISLLREKGYDVATEIKSVSIFWKAEDYHQQYYEKNGKTPYCHQWRKIF